MLCSKVYKCTTFIKLSHIFFQSDCNLLNFIIFYWSKWLFWFIFSATIFQRSYWSTFSLILYIIQLLLFQLNWCRVSSHFAQIYIFLITKKAAKLSVCLLARHVLFCFCSFFREWSVNVFCPLLQQIVSHALSGFWNLKYTFFLLILSWYHVYKYLLQVLEIL